MAEISIELSEQQIKELLDDGQTSVDIPDAIIDPEPSVSIIYDGRLKYPDEDQL